MKQFKPFDKVLYRPASTNIWIPDIYSFSDRKEHCVIGCPNYIEDKNIIPYEGNEYLVGTANEPEEKIALKKGELILCSDSLLALMDGLGVINHFITVGCDSIATHPCPYNYCIPMSKYNPNDLEETKKWILRVTNGKLVKVNK